MFPRNSQSPQCGDAEYNLVQHQNQMLLLPLLMVLLLYIRNRYCAELHISVSRLPLVGPALLLRGKGFIMGCLHTVDICKIMPKSWATVRSKQAFINELVTFAWTRATELNRYFSVSIRWAIAQWNEVNEKVPRSCCERCGYEYYTHVLLNYWWMFLNMCSIACHHTSSSYEDSNQFHKQLCLSSIYIMPCPPDTIYFIFIIKLIVGTVSQISFIPLFEPQHEYIFTS